MESVFNVAEAVALKNLLIAKIGEFRYLVELYPDYEQFKVDLKMYEALDSKISKLY